MKKVISIILAILMLLTLTACSDKQDEPTQTQVSSNEVSTDENKKHNGVLSSFSSVDLEGKSVSADIFKGHKITMVNIWATFCGPCVYEMPFIQEISESYADKGVQVVGIVCDVTLLPDGSYSQSLLQSAKDIVEETGVKYTNILPSEDLNRAKLDQVYSVPETIFVDEYGNQIGTAYVGSRSYESWAAIIDSLLNPPQEGLTE